MDILLLSTEDDVWSLGLRGISAVLKAAGHCTHLMFMATKERRFTQAMLDEVAARAHQVDIIGVSCIALGSDKAKQTIEYLKPQKKLVIWGGVHASLNPEECADYADIVCVGEGEGMMLDLVERLAGGNSWKDIENIAYKENGIFKQNAVRPPIADLDALPLPDFTFDSEYHWTPEGFVQVATLPDFKNSGQIIFNSSRGCAFHCTYCCNNRLKSLYPVKGGYVRRMSVPRLIEHAQNLKHIFPQGKFIYFIDEDFAARPVNELAQIAAELPVKVGLPFACLAHPARITEEKMDLLVKAGMFRIHLGIESGSERTKKEIYDRHESNAIVKRSTEIISRFSGVVPIYFFIYANPYEERDDVIATIRFIASLPAGCLLQTYNLVFFPGSDLYNRALQDGWIGGDYDSGYELHILGGYQYKGHAWKQRNIYYNGLIFLMDGWCTRHGIGSLPRFTLKAFLHPRVMEFNERHVSCIKGLISIKFFLMRMRSVAIHIIRRIIGNRSVVTFNLGSHLRTKTR